MLLLVVVFKLLAQINILRCTFVQHVYTLYNLSITQSGYRSINESGGAWSKLLLESTLHFYMFATSPPLLATDISWEISLLCCNFILFLFRKTQITEVICMTLREKCPNTELFLVRIFLYSDWIQRFTE